MTIEIVTLACAGDCADIEAVARGGNPPYAFAWEDGSTDPKRHVCLDDSATLTVDASDTAIKTEEFSYPGSTVSADVTATVLDCSDAGPPVMGGECGPADPQNLVWNGGFECPAVAAGSFEDFEPGATFEGWRVIGAPGTVSVLSGTYVGISSMGGVIVFAPHDGAQTLDLSGTSSTATGVEQTLSTVAGDAYELSFWIGNAGDLAWGLDSAVDVLVDGALVLSARNGTVAPNGLSWQQSTTTFTATSSATTVAFISADLVADASNILDDVVVRHVEQ
jgi:hypothetical protein